MGVLHRTLITRTKSKPEENLVKYHVLFGMVSSLIWYGIISYLVWYHQLQGFLYSCKILVSASALFIHSNPLPIAKDTGLGERLTREANQAVASVQTAPQTCI